MVNYALPTNLNYISTPLPPRVLAKHPEIPADILQDFSEVINKKLVKFHHDSGIKRFGTCGLDLEDPCDLVKLCAAFNMSDQPTDD